MPKPFKTTHIAHITDTTDDNARSKILSSYIGAIGRLGLRNAFSEIREGLNTVTIGIKASELIHNPRRPDQILLGLNCAPAEKKEGTKGNNHRKNFFFADLGDGVFAGGTTGGYEFSYVKPRIKSLFELTTTNETDSQFRSNDVLPENLLAFANKTHRNRLIKSGDFVRIENVDDYIPNVPDVTHVIEIDNFGNVKLAPSQKDRALIESTKKIDFTFHSSTLEADREDHPSNGSYPALVAPKLFAARMNSNVLARNSSSLVFGNAAVPMIAEIRKNPGETQPAYIKQSPVPPIVSTRIKLERGTMPAAYYR